MARRFLAMAVALIIAGAPAIVMGASPTSSSHATSSSHSGFSKPSTPHTAPPNESDLAPHGGFTKPQVQEQKPSTMGFTKPQQQPSPGGSGFTKPGATQAATAAPLVSPPRSVVDATIAKGQSKAALQQFDADRRRYNAPPVGGFATPKAAQQSPVWRQYGSNWQSPDAYYAARRAAEGRLPPQARIYYAAPPVWVSSGPPSYGAYSSHFLGGVLLGMAGTLAYDQWAYSHWNDPAIMQWREEMAQKAQDDAELRDKLDTLNARVAELQAKNAPVTDALPSDVDPSLVVAPETVMMATTHTGFNWWLWTPIILILLGIAFVGSCIMVARNRSKGSYA